MTAPALRVIVTQGHRNTSGGNPGEAARIPRIRRVRRIGGPPAGDRHRAVASPAGLCRDHPGGDGGAGPGQRVPGCRLDHRRARGGQPGVVAGRTRSRGQAALADVVGWHRPGRSRDPRPPPRLTRPVTPRPIRLHHLSFRACEESLREAHRTKSDTCPAGRTRFLVTPQPPPAESASHGDGSTPRQGWSSLPGRERARERVVRGGAFAGAQGDGGEGCPRQNTLERRTP